MKYYDFKLALTSPTKPIDPLTAEIESIFGGLQDNPSLASVDIVAEGSEKVAFFIGSEELGIKEIEDLLVSELVAVGRTPESYTITAPQKEY